MTKRTDTMELTCRLEAESLDKYRERLPEKVEKIVESCSDKECYTHIDYEPIPSKAVVIEIIDKIREVLFPGYFSKEKVDPVTLKYVVGQSVSQIFEMVSEQIINSIRHDCLRYQKTCIECVEKGQEICLDFLETIPGIRKTLATDVLATFEGDPAAKNHDEIIFSYPGIFAISVYRVAHALHGLGVPLLPRIMTEYAHGETGIDIHPGAKIGERFCIDHGTGIVIGETTVIGRNVRIYQGVTLGGLSVPKDAADNLRGQKRHPTIEEDVVIYSGATILGGNTVIGARSVIGGNVWITESVPPDTKVMLEKPRLVYK